MTMAKYVILATFTDQGVRTAKESPKRAEAFRQMAKTFGVTVKEIFWTQGRYDIVAITEAPDEIAATALNLSLSALGNIRTESLRAFSPEEMTKIVGKMIWPAPINRPNRERPNREHYAPQIRKLALFRLRWACPLLD
jgi:uncharacterized protein with GYD domain